MDLPEKDVAAMLINPFYAITLSEELFYEHHPETSADDWIISSASEIKERGAHAWLTNLLHELSGKKAGGSNLNDVVMISERLHGEHEPMVEQQQWVEVNKKLMDELGVVAWLSQFLETLETGGPVV